MPINLILQKVHVCPKCQPANYLLINQTVSAFEMLYKAAQNI
jgi:hypothetical protein